MTSAHQAPVVDLTRDDNEPQVAAIARGGAGPQASGHKRAAVAYVNLLDDDSGGEDGGGDGGGEGDGAVVPAKHRRLAGHSGSASSSAAAIELPAADEADTARWKAEAERWRAEAQRLQALLQLVPVPNADPRLSAPLPSHWAAYAPEERPDELKLVVLPLPADPDHHELYPPHVTPTEPSDEHRNITITRLLDQGVLLDDAVDALEHCGWQEGPALQYAQLTAEVETVLRRFEATEADVSAVEALGLPVMSQMPRSLVKRIERVQNRPLLTKYNMRRSELLNSPLVVHAGESHATSPGLHERWLWHGAHLKSAASILKHGFDIRYANLDSGDGVGIYFAESSSTSAAFSVAGASTGNILGAARRLSWAKEGKGRSAGVHGTSTSAHFHDIACDPDQQQHPGRQPHEWRAPLVMILSRVLLGKVTYNNAPGMRVPPEGYYSAGVPLDMYFVIFDNAQAVPEYVVHFDDPGYAALTQPAFVKKLRAAEYQ